MKRNFLAILFSAVAFIGSINKVNAQSILVYYWNYNITDTSVHTPQYTVAGGGSASCQYYGDPATGYIDFTNPGTFLNAQMSADSGGSLRLRTPYDSVIFFMPTTGYANVHFSYATEKSGSGATPVYIYYSNDGSTFMPTCVTDLVDSCVYSVNTTWDVHTFNFSADAATANNTHFAIKIAYTGWTAAGNNRFDNVALKGDLNNPSLGTNNVIGIEAEYTLAPNPAMNSIKISSKNSATKSVVITNVVGQKVYSTLETGNNFEVNTTNLISGVYYINIHENETGYTNTMKFVKQ